MMMAQAYPPHPGQLQPVPTHGIQPPIHAPPGQPNAHALQHLNPHQGLGPGMNQQVLQQQQQIAQARLINQYRQRAAAQQMHMGGIPNPGHPMSGPVAGFGGPHVQNNLHPQIQQAQLQQQLLRQQQQQILHQQQQQAAIQQAQQQQAQNAAALNLQQQQQQQQQLVTQQQIQAQQQQQQQQHQAAAAAQQQVAAAQMQQQQQQNPQQPTPQQQAALQQMQQQQQPTPQQTPQQNPQVPQPVPAPQQQQQQQQIALAAAQAQQQLPQQIRAQQKLGTAVLKLLQFCEHLSSPEGNKRDINFWRKFVGDFYSPTGVMRHNLWQSSTKETKRFEITTPVLPRYYLALYDHGIKNIQLVMENAREREVNTSSHVESTRTSFIYVFENGTQVVAHGILRASLNSMNQIDILEFDTTEHHEYIPRRALTTALRSLTNSPDQKASPRVTNKALGKRLQPAQSISLPESPIGVWGVPDKVFKFFELAETLSSMRDLFGFSQQYPNLEPKQVLATYVQQYQSQQQQLAQQQVLQMQQVAQNAQAQGGQQQQIMGMGTPQMANALPPGMQGSPATSELRMGSPHIPPNGIPVATPSPAQSHLQAPGMVAQHSQQHHQTNGATPVNANTSPNQSGKRRRASTTTVKNEAGDDADVAVANPKVKASPRVGNNNKRQKQNS